MIQQLIEHEYFWEVLVTLLIGYYMVVIYMFFGKTITAFFNKDNFFKKSSGITHSDLRIALSAQRKILLDQKENLDREELELLERSLFKKILIEGKN